MHLRIMYIIWLLVKILCGCLSFSLKCNLSPVCMSLLIFLCDLFIVEIKVLKSLLLLYCYLSLEIMYFIYLCSNVNCIFIYNCYRLLMNRYFYHYIITHSVSLQLLTWSTLSHIITVTLDIFWLFSISILILSLHFQSVFPH